MARPSRRGVAEADAARVTLKAQAARAIHAEMPQAEVNVITAPRALDSESILERDLVIAGRDFDAVVATLRQRVPHLRAAELLPGCGHWTHPGRMMVSRSAGTTCFKTGSSCSLPRTDRTRSRSPATYSAGTVTLALVHGASSSQLRSMFRYQLRPPRNPVRVNSPA